MWSPQHYISFGKAKGVDQNVLNSAADQIDRVLSGQYRLPSVLTLNHLAYRTDVSYKVLRTLVERSHLSPYRHFYIRKRAGGKRLISIPSAELMTVQRWIAHHILREIPVHQSSFAFSPGNSIVQCAARHTGARWIVKMDVADFFGSITEIQVYRVFKGLGYQPLVAFELARICTHQLERSRKHLLKSWQVWRPRAAIPNYQNRTMGRLPQGAPTSPMLSNLVMRDIDPILAAVARKAGMTYTRYSDDLTFSTRDSDFERAKALLMIQEISSTLKSFGLFPKKKKTVVVPPGARKVVLGLLVDGDIPRLPPAFKDLLRQHLYYLKKVGPFEHAKARNFETVGGMYRHIRGLIDFAKMVEPVYASKQIAIFNSVNWPMQCT